MASNYYQATLAPDSIHLNEMQVIYLEATGATCEQESDGRYYVYWQECLDEDEENIADRVRDALEEGEVDQQMADAIGKLSFRELLRDILTNSANEKVTHLRIEGAWTCDKMRPGEFGGAATIISRSQYATVGTHSARYNPTTGKIELCYCDIVDF